MRRPLAAVPWMVAAAVAAVATLWVTTAWLLGSANTTDAGVDRARVQMEAVRTGLAASAVAGAAVGLLLVFRRQTHQEFDSAESRVTDLYNVAAEQLGSDKAPVRLTALYTLERPANDNRDHRQTIVNIICAYLRMPYRPDAFEMHGERQVRLTAQRMLSSHLSPVAAVHWDGLSLDLSDAVLIDFSPRRCNDWQAGIRALAKLKCDGEWRWKHPASVWRRSVIS